MDDVLYPGSTMERFLADRIVSLAWRLERVRRSQDAVLEVLYDRQTAQPSAGPEPAQAPGANAGTPAADPPVLGRLLVADFEADRVLERVLVYERRLESSLYRTMAELRRWQRERATAEREGVGRRETDYRGGYSLRPAAADDAESAPGDDTPEGVGTDAAPGEKSCQTHPTRSAGCVSRTLPSPAQGYRWAVSNETCQTKPMGRGEPLPAANETCQTKPMGPGEPLGAATEMRQTNPMCDGTSGARRTSMDHA